MRVKNFERVLVFIAIVVSTVCFAVGTSFAGKAHAYENTYSAGNDYSDATALEERYAELETDIEAKETALGGDALGFAEVKEFLRSKFEHDEISAGKHG